MSENLVFLLRHGQRSILCGFLFFLLISLTACSSLYGGDSKPSSRMDKAETNPVPSSPVLSPRDEQNISLSKIAWNRNAQLPQNFFDDRNFRGLKRAIFNQLRATKKVPSSQSVHLGGVKVDQKRIRKTLVSFLSLLDQKMSQEQLSYEIRKRFWIIPAGKGSDHDVLFTGYYTPVVQASRKRQGKYQYPLYRLPDETAKAGNLDGPPIMTARGNLDLQWRARSVQDVTKLTRKEIDGHQMLRHTGLEIAWLKNDLDRYFLHIQGSGYLSFPDGTIQAARFMGSNKKKYKSIGRQMMRDGAIGEGEASMQGIKAYFKRHPENKEKYLYQNPRYIFFEMSDGPPLGASGSPLVPGRSIATDKRHYPTGGLVFLSSLKPILGENNRIKKWSRFSRFVVDQDSGSAIKGKGRADFYYGIGEKAGIKAGHFKEQGKMFYLLHK